MDSRGLMYGNEHRTKKPQYPKKVKGCRLVLARVCGEGRQAFVFLARVVGEGCPVLITLDGLLGSENLKVKPRLIIPLPSMV